MQNEVYSHTFVCIGIIEKKRVLCGATRREDFVIGRSAVQVRSSAPFLTPSEVLVYRFGHCAEVGFTVPLPSPKL